jgi:hypothetical protein
MCFDRLWTDSATASEGDDRLCRGGEESLINGCERLPLVINVRADYLTSATLSRRRPVELLRQAQNYLSLPVASLFCFAALDQLEEVRH